MATKKLTKRQLKEDPVMTTAFRWVGFTEQHLRALLIAIGAVLVVAGLFYFVRQGRSSAERSAATRLAQARAEIQQGNIESAMTMVDQILDRSGGTNSGREALLLRADGALLLGKNEEAIEHYGRFLRQEKDPVLRASALRGLAGALEQSGQAARAAESYLEAGRQNAIGGEAAYDLMAAARAYRMAGDHAKAIALYEEIVEKHPKFTRLQEVNVARAELGGTQAKDATR